MSNPVGKQDSQSSQAIHNIRLSLENATCRPDTDGKCYVIRGSTNLTQTPLEDLCCRVYKLKQNSSNWKDADYKDYQFTLQRLNDLEENCRDMYLKKFTFIEKFVFYCCTYDLHPMPVRDIFFDDNHKPYCYRLLQRVTPQDAYERLPE